MQATIADYGESQAGLRDRHMPAVEVISEKFIEV
jgi:hypothetical protein